MKSLFRTAALLTAIGLASGCTGPRRFDRNMGSVRLPSAPVLEPSPAAVDPDKVGTVGSPAKPQQQNMAPLAPLTPMGE